MQNLQHAAIYVQRDTDKPWLIKQILQGDLFGDDLKLGSLKVEVFSGIALQYFIDEELKHDHFEIETGLNTALSNASSGEQRKALLAYIISKKPAYIILDEVFESLDIQTRSSLLIMLQELHSEISFIQLFSRKEDLLPFIETVYLLEDNIVTAKMNREGFLQLNTGIIISRAKSIIPPPLQPYQPTSYPLVKMKNVSVTYNERQVLNKISWQISPGEFWQLKGPNGSGKSTLLSMINGDNPKAYGQDIELFGKQKGTGESVWQIKEKTGYFSPNMTRHFERLDSIKQMIIGGFFDSVGLYIKPADMQVKLADEWLQLIDLYKQRDKPFRFFQPGQQRLIMIARAMIKHPLLLILDEPTSGLDDESVALFTTLVNQIATETKTAIIYVSHRDEPGLGPTNIFELEPGKIGSTGKVVKEK